MPANARPSEAPMMLASAKGVSTTRSAPKRSTRPLVVRKTPPSLPTSRPRTMTRGSLSISSARALLMASTMFRSGMSASAAVDELGPLPEDARWRILVHVGEHVLRPGRRGAGRVLERLFVLLTQLLGPLHLAFGVPHAQAGEVALDALDRVARARLLELLRVLMAGGIVGGVVEAHPVGDRFDEARSLAVSGALDSVACRVVNGHDVIAVDLDAFEAVTGGAQRKAWGRRLDAPRGRDRPLVVLQKERDRRLDNARQVERLVEIAFGRAAIADVGDDHRVLAPETESPRQAGGLRKLRRDRDLCRQDPDPVGDARRGDLAEVLGRDDLQRQAVVDRRHQLAVLRHHPVPARIDGHRGADDRGLLSRAGREHPELALALQRYHALVVETRFHHPAQGFEQELLFHARLRPGGDRAVRQQDRAPTLHGPILAQLSTPAGVPLRPGPAAPAERRALR